jgi:hypothetical protein
MAIASVVFPAALPVTITVEYWKAMKPLFKNIP